jgi:helix-turn-helix protein
MPRRSNANGPAGSSPTTRPEPLETLPEKPMVVARRFEDRWGDDRILFSHGYSMVPNIFLQKYGQLTPPLSVGEAMFVLELMSYKYGADSPYPSYGAIARNMNVSDKMVRRYAQSLEAKGYLQRVARKYKTNRFDLHGLFYALNRVALRKQQNAIKQKGRTLTDN